MRSPTLLALALSVTACGGGAAAPPSDDAGLAAFPVGADGPPRASAEFPAWVAAESYADWTCESAPHEARPPSPHGSNRICMNAIATSARDAGGPFPPGSAWLKEQIDAEGNVWAIEISRRESDAPGVGGWRWWRGTGDGFATITQDVFDDGFCAPCHAGAERDFVFTIVP